MAMILSAFATNFMRILVQITQQEVGQLLGIPNEVEKLTRMVHRIQGIITDAESRQADSEAINRWVRELKDVMYDAEDVIDLCRIKAEERVVRSASSSSEASFGFNFRILLRSPGFARNISSKIRKLNSRMNDLVSEIPLLGLNEQRGVSSDTWGRAWHINRINSPIVVLSDLVGEKIEEDANQLVDLLTNETSQEQENIPIVALVGMGGIGKTTLAKKVYSDPRIKEEFKLLIWICVSKELRPVEALKNVTREVGGDYGAAEEISELIPILERYVSGKKFLLFLDDIWPESEGVWSGLLRDAMIKGATGSSVLITTRDGRVAHHMKATHFHKVGTLSDKDGWSLLAKQVGLNGDEIDIQDLKDIGLQIVQKCDGLPLAIKSVGGMLCRKGKTRSEWKSVLRSNVWSINGLPSDVHRAFYLSYEDLPPPLKQCFIIFSLFPEDYMFRRSQLIYLWLAEGFLQDEGDIWDLGNEYYNELLLRNLLEDTGHYYNQSECKMHDLLWSFSCYLGRDENCVLRKGQTLLGRKYSLKLRWLSIEGNDVKHEIIKREKCLRTLFLHNKPEISFNTLCKAIPYLRILDLKMSAIPSLPDSLCALVHLRYLDVGDSNIRTLPNLLGNLRKLVYLNCSGCKQLFDVPDSIINLRELRFLSFYNSKVEALAEGLKNLTKLIEIRAFKPYKDNLKGFSSLDALKALSQLVTLHLEKLEKVSDINIAKRANLLRKIQLKKLSFTYTTLSLKDQLSQTNNKKIAIENVLNELCPPRFLEILAIEYYFGTCLPKWLSVWVGFPNLRFLDLKNCSCFERFPPLGQLPNLDYLRVKGAYSVVSIGEELFWGDIITIDTCTMSHPSIPAFPKLNELIFDGMPNWKEWKWIKGKLAMPNLKKFIIKSCPQLRSLPEGLLHHATSLEYLEVRNNENLSTIENLSSIKYIHVVENANLERMSNLPSISYILIQNCPSLQYVENLKTSQRMELTDYRMEMFPSYLMMIMPQKLTIRCNKELLLKFVSQERSGAEWQKLIHIPKVKVCTEDESLFATYQETPYSFTTNVFVKSELSDRIFV